MTCSHVVRQRTERYVFDPRRAIAVVIGAMALCAHADAQERRPSLAGTWALAGNGGGGAPTGPAQQDASGDRPGRLVESVIAGLRIDSSRLRQVQDSLRGIIDTPVRLSIVQTESMVIVTGSNGYTMRLSPGTRGIKDESNGIEMKTRWDHDALVTEISGIASDKIIETYSVDVAHRLHVVVKLPLTRRAQVPDIHRIYEAVPNP